MKLFPFLAMSLLASSGSVASETNESFHPENKAGHGLDLGVVPLPTHYTTGNQVLCLSPDFEIQFDKSLQGNKLPEDLIQATKRTERNLWANRHQYLSIQRGAELFVTPNTKDGCKYSLKKLLVIIEQDEKGEVRSIMDSAIRPAEERPDLEQYTLSLPLSGPAVLKASTALGILRGLTTFENLFYYLPHKGRGVDTGPLLDFDLGQDSQLFTHDTGRFQWDQQDQQTESGSVNRNPGVMYAPTAPYEIQDKPAFGWRAIMLDTSRNYFSKKSIFKMLDTMSLVKLNVFHWHITDSNSWPLDLSSHPELAQHGAYGPDQRYTDSDIKQIVRYAGERGIDTVIEIDTPGHTASIAESHPDLVAGFERNPWQTYSGQPPAGQLRFASKGAVDLTKEIFETTLDLVKSRYFGTGGDEVNEACMLEDEETAAALKANGWSLDDAINDYTGKTHAIILNRQKIPVVWQEMVLAHGNLANLSKDAIVDVWINSADARQVLDKGFKIIHAASDYFYLAHGLGEWVGRQEGKGKGKHNFGNPYKSWQRMYSFNPYENVDESQKSQVLGGQASLWSEQTDETNLESVMWPRAAAVAELFWTGSGPDGYPRNPIEAFPRMHDIRYRLVDRGVQAPPLQPHWCALRPGLCNDDL